jgi:diguanylate cyclase (GGDEF)-like protein
VISWEQAVSKQLRLLRLESIRNKLLAFAVLATLIPSCSTAWVSYTHNKRSLRDKITGQLQSVSSETAREIDLWIKERLYDLRVFASSYEVSENLDPKAKPGRHALTRLNDYLSSVRERFSDYEELIVMDASGRAVATSATKTGPVPLPENWLTEVRTNGAALGVPYWDDAHGRVVMVAAVPIRLANGRFMGALTAKLNLGTVDDILKRAIPDSSARVYLITAQGKVITSSNIGSTPPMRSQLPAATNRALVKRQATTLEYSGFDQQRVVGSLRQIPRLNWSVVSEVPVRKAYEQSIRLRNETALIVTALLLGVGLLAYFLGLLIVRPLDRLTRGAAEVAAGDLAVDLPVTSGGEVGYLTEVFNNMVARLREGRQELERLSATDVVTKLYNRRHLMETLANEIQRCRRHQRILSVVMLDVDEFKKYNDAFGHQAGDKVLVEVASVLRKFTRDVDCVARYGGEEFLLVLPETQIEGATLVSERVREHLADKEFGGGKITLSIGIAEFPAHGDSPEAVIASADAAMYQAKRAGRDRVAVAKRSAARTSRRGA